MSQCGYDYKYANGQSKQCAEVSLPNDDKCVFHSSDISKGSTFIKAFQDKEEFDFTGYVFPVELKDDIFPKEAIKEGSESSTTTFNTKLIFKQTSFLKGVTLSYSIFEESIDMSECQFHGDCYFNGSEFKGEVILDGATVHDKLSFDESRFCTTLSWDNAPFDVKASEGEISFT